LERVPLFDCVETPTVTATGQEKTLTACPHCFERGVTEQIDGRAAKHAAVPVLVSYTCLNGCKPTRQQRRHNDPDTKKRAYFALHDERKVREIEAKEIPHWYPRDRMMHAPGTDERWGVKWRAGSSNFRTVDELFTRR